MDPSQKNASRESQTSQLNHMQTKLRRKKKPTSVSVLSILAKRKRNLVEKGVYIPREVG